MEYTNVFNLISGLSNSVAVVVAIIAIYSSSRNNRHQILTGKLEELYQVIDQASQYYHILIGLNFSVEEYQQQNNGELKSITQYYVVRDRSLATEDRQKIETYISRIEVLGKCYTNGDLQQSIMHYRQLIGLLYQKVAHLNSITAEVFYSTGFPNYNDHLEILEKLKTRILVKMTIK
ncbi:MAG: hypothetical protein K0Q79_3627 [Flavipsychrobacter sp.]|jgi:hypothetical protein|nr:hypothetical protein [Flavipsychrobacter sp.]